MAAELHILGSAGWMPSAGRETCCAVLRCGEHAVIIDAGTGVARLAEDPAPLAGARAIDIVLTHFHADHITGLAYLRGVGLPVQPTLWAPGERLYATPSAAILGRLFAQPVSAPIALAVREVPAEGFELGPWTVRTRVQERHTVATLGLRFDDALAWVTDTAHDPGSVELARGVDVLCHEAWWHADDATDTASHSSGAQAAAVAAQAGVRRLLTNHHHPRPGRSDAVEREARAVFPAAAAARDGERVELAV